MTSCCTSILRIGGPLGSEEPISILQTELFHHFSSREKANDQQLNISNKYFTATVQILPLFQNENDQNDNDGSIAVVEKDPIFKEDGILLVFPSNHTQIETLTQVHDKLIQSNEMVGDTLRLCIATYVGSVSSANSTKSHQEEYSKRVLWCLDRGYEYVEVDLSEKGLTTGFDEREKDGFARVVEAIGGTVWSSAIMMKGNINVNGKGTCVGMDMDMGAVAGSLGVGEVSSNTTTKNVTTDSNNVAATGSQGLAAKLSEDGNDDDDDDDDGRDSAIASNEESTLENIEHIMEEAKRIRESSRMGQLSDDERRKRAGNAAEVLMGLLDQIGVYDDIDDSDSDCS
eukprot:CAMPEP_0176505138 /NCGR_PEP_ID=MMETSP0200_2-20121128/16328_1 /TAXON_ID=947934 /ORGANISM="Chaetoceros sp., Strain GSL56" /LENGTH=342 /DNA_ID=CAMNT_0017904659 /DNA_START=1352 /DNA_END=2383 /DNA_ORIENTATION=-